MATQLIGFSRPATFLPDVSLSSEDIAVARAQRPVTHGRAWMVGRGVALPSDAEIRRRCRISFALHQKSKAFLRLETMQIIKRVGDPNSPDPYAWSSTFGWKASA